MAIEKGIIVEEAGNNVLIEAEAYHACASCEARHICVPGGDIKKRSILVKNTINVHPGDYVEFEVKEKSVVISSMLIYLFPIISLVTGAIIGASLEQYLPLDRDLSAGIVGFTAFLLSFVIIRFITPVLTGKPSFMPRLVRKISSEEYCKTLNM